MGPRAHVWRRIHSILILVVPLLAYVASSQAIPATTDGGSVEGIIIDENGKPLPDANVYALPARDMRTQIPTVSNAKGYFVIDDLPPGNVYIQAYKESSGYPYAFFSFYKTNDRQSVKVSVTAGNVTSGIVIQLGPKAAFLKFDLSGSQGRPISSAVATFRRDDMPGDYKRTIQNGATIMVPPVPFHLSLEQEGYRPWIYRGATGRDNRAEIRLTPGQSLELKVQFVPTPIQ